tara:strand:+ start:106 stop:390 length:285 start_codon:yes stop_codon:yes gene_type:complete
MSDTNTVERLLARLPEDERDAPVPLLKAGRVVDKLVGTDPAGATLHRWAHKKAPRLEVLRVGNARYVTARLLAEFFVANGRTTAVPPKRRRKAS